MDIKSGDFVEHNSLGVCEVISVLPKELPNHALLIIPEKMAEDWLKDEWEKMVIVFGMRPVTCPDKVRRAGRDGRLFHSSGAFLKAYAWENEEE